MVLYRSSFQLLVGYIAVMVVVNRYHVVDSFNLAQTSSRYRGGTVSSATECRMVNEWGEKFDIQDIPLDENNEIDINYTSDEEEEVDNEALINNKKKIECSGELDVFEFCVSIINLPKLLASHLVQLASCCHFQKMLLLLPFLI